MRLLAEIYRLRPMLYGSIVLLCLLLCSLLSGALFTQFAQAYQDSPSRVLMPFGGGYTDIYSDFVDEAIAHARNNSVSILVLPFAAAPDPQTISESQRIAILQDVEFRRLQIEEACTRGSPVELECQVSVAPVLVRADASDNAMLDFFTSDLAAVFILDGDPTIAMQVISGTPIESALLMAYQNGVLIAGTGSGGAIFSNVIVGGYDQKFSNASSLDFGAVNLWNTAENHGVVFGLSDILIEQQFFQKGKLGYLLNAISLPNAPGLGMGVDSHTGLKIVENTRLDEVVGLYAVAILDAGTYHAANTMQYGGPDHTISLRNVLVHLVPPGDFSFDIEQRSFSSFMAAGQPVAPLYQVTRNFEALALPVGAGNLILSGGLSDLSPQNPALSRLLATSGTVPSRVLIFGDGFPSTSAAQQLLAEYQIALGGSAIVVNLDPEDTQLPELPASDTYDAIFLVGNDQSRLHPAIIVDWLRQEWLNGKTVMAENAAAAALGSYYSAHGPTPNAGLGQELAAQMSLKLNRTNLQPGMGLISVGIEPQVLGNNRWGRIFSLGYNHPEGIVLALPEDGLVEITPDGARVIGDNGVIVLDLRMARLGLGSNQAFAIANGLMDVFAPGESLIPQRASLMPVFARAATPFIPTATATLAPSSTPEPPTPIPTRTPVPTRTPRATATPPTIPPASDPDTSHIMVLVGALVVIVIVFGIWLNRSRVF